IALGLLCLVCFFFSSRRRHTRSKRDWSSDVCSSDLFLGSIIIIFTSWGFARINIVVIILFTQTLLPLPVAPAINRWGILFNSASTASPDISLPKATNNLEVCLFNELSKTSLKETIAISWLGNFITT